MNIDNRKSFLMLLNVSDLIDVILYWNANNCKINVILYVVVYQRNILNKVSKRFSLQPFMI
jgi:pantothenate kinase